VEAGFVVGQDVPDDDQDGSADRDDALLLAAAPGDPAVALTEEGVGLAGSDGGFTEHPSEVGLTVTGGSGALLAAGGLLDPRHELRPRRQVPGSGEPAHVQADLRDDDVRGGASDAGDLIETFHRVTERGNLLLDPGVQGVDVGADRIDPSEDPGQQERVMVG